MTTSEGPLIGPFRRGLFLFKKRDRQTAPAACFCLPQTCIINREASFYSKFHRRYKNEIIEVLFIFNISGDER